MEIAGSLSLLTFITLALLVGFVAGVYLLAAFA